MSRLVAAELLKIRTTRTGWVFFASGLGLSLLTIVGNLAVGEFQDPEAVTGLFVTASLGGLMMLLLGIVGATGEHRHGTVTPTFLVSPVRERVVAAKAIAYTLAGVAFTAAIELVTALIAVPWLAVKGASSPPADELALLLLGQLLYGGIAGALGVGVGTLVRNQVAAVVIVLVEFLAVEPVVGALVPDIGKYGPQGAALSLLSGGLGGTVPMWAGGLVYVGYALVALGAGALLDSRRDVS